MRMLQKCFASCLPFLQNFHWLLRRMSSTPHNCCLHSRCRAPSFSKATTMPGADHIYEPLPTSESLRILVVAPAKDTHDEVRRDIKTTSTDDKPDYVALSYSRGMNVTGHASACRSVTIRGKNVPVTQHLYEGLLRLRDPSVDLHIWIDAICINRSDMAERSSQVAPMGRI